MCVKDTRVTGHAWYDEHTSGRAIVRSKFKGTFLDPSKCRRPGARPAWVTFVETIKA
jgi:hypothetical protein